MPYISEWPLRRLIAVTAALVAFALTILAGASVASADTLPCPTPSAAPVFSPFGDSADYALVPGGDFEGDMSGWTLNGASVVSGNEPWSVGGAADSQSLNIAPGGSAISAPFCVSDQFPSWRFFAQLDGGPGRSWLDVSVQWSDQYGDSGVTQVARLRGGTYRTWRPTDSLQLGPALNADATMTEQLVFSAGGASGWQIDDVYIDPYAKR